MDFFETDSMNFVLGQLIRVYHCRTHMLLGKLGLYPGQPPILFMLWKKDGCSQKELAEKLHVKPATITVMLRRMEKAGLLERREDSQDLRVSRVYLAQKGKEILQQLEEVLKVVEKECYKGFTDEERILLRRFLIQMRENLINSCKE